jgi:hypothetical protein
VNPNCLSEAKRVMQGVLFEGGEVKFFSYVSYPIGPVYSNLKTGKCDRPRAALSKKGLMEYRFQDKLAPSLTLI